MFVSVQPTKLTLIIKQVNIIETFHSSLPQHENIQNYNFLNNSKKLFGFTPDDPISDLRTKQTAGLYSFNDLQIETFLFRLCKTNKV